MDERWSDEKETWGRRRLTVTPFHHSASSLSDFLHLRIQTRALGPLIGCHETIHPFLAYNQTYGVDPIIVCIHCHKITSNIIKCLEMTLRFRQSPGLHFYQVLHFLTLITDSVSELDSSISDEELSSAELMLTPPSLKKSPELSLI